tara:strand:- start:325 stop:642 length:318 start_codon:yes stop_codon:yes gene_type:complete
MQSTLIIYAVLSAILGLTVYVTSAKLLKLKVSPVITQLEKHAISSCLLIGILGTYIGFFIGFSEGLSQESTAEAIATAVPTSIAGLIVALLTATMVTLRGDKTHE